MSEHNNSVIENFLSLFPSTQLSDNKEKISIHSENNKTFIKLQLIDYPYHNDSIDIAFFDFDKRIISFYEQHRIIFQELIEKLYKNKDSLKMLKSYKKYLIDESSVFSFAKEKIDMIINEIENCSDFAKIKELFFEAFTMLDFSYKSPKILANEDTDYLIEKLIKAISGLYTRNWVQDHRIIMSFDMFNYFYTAYSSYLSNTLIKIKNNLAAYCYGKQVSEKLIPYISSNYLDHAKIEFNLNSGDTHSVIVNIENNHWRNGVIKGDMLLARIKANGKNKYIFFKKSLSNLFENQNIKYDTSDTYDKNSIIIIELETFISNLHENKKGIKEILNTAFLKAISFPEFGCCSKYSECEKTGKCLHCDQLYATACQYQKLLKRTGKFE